jgi:hypothetical protein
MFVHLSSKKRTARSFGGLRMTEKGGCHPMFAHLSSKKRTARSFGGLRMTKMGCRPWDDASPFFCHPEASEGSGCSTF